jgi:DNA polymerase-3 subunit epsilon
VREIVIDTETTGLNPFAGDRIVEVGCIELVNHIPTGRTFQAYVNPERDIPAESERVHGLTATFLQDKPVFAAIVEDLLAFVGDAPLIAHNAGFDMGFINAELKRLNRAPLAADRTIDTVELARRKFPGAQASLDALCRRFQIDIAHRSKHGALLDAELLAKVYLELVGGREPALLLNVAATESSVSPTAASIVVERPPRAHAPTPDEAAAHNAFLATLKDPIWLRG